MLAHFVRSQAAEQAERGTDVLFTIFITHSCLERFYPLVTHRNVLYSNIPSAYEIISNAFERMNRIASFAYVSEHYTGGVLPFVRFFVPVRGLRAMEGATEAQRTRWSRLIFEVAKFEFDYIGRRCCCMH